MAAGWGAGIQQQSKEGEAKSTSLAEATCCLLHRFEMLIVTFNWNGLKKKKKWLVIKQNKIKKTKTKLAAPAAVPAPAGADTEVMAPTAASLICLTARISWGQAEFTLICTLTHK